MGVDDAKHKGSVVPMQTYTALPSQNNRLYPHPIFYVGIGNYKVGEFVDKAAAGEIAKLDFSGSAIQTAYLILTPKGQWEDDAGQTAKNKVKFSRQSS